MLRALGYRLDIRRPRFGDPLPETLDAHAGAIIFGGPMSANDPHGVCDTRSPGSRFRCASRGRFWSFCLGAQILAMQLGAGVALHPQSLTRSATTRYARRAVRRLNRSSLSVAPRRL